MRDPTPRRKATPLDAHQPPKAIGRAEVGVARECEKAALERDVTARIQNQLATQIEILRKSQSMRNEEAEGFRAFLSPPLTTGNHPR